MNYCAAQQTKLSADDVAGFKRAYGFVTGLTAGQCTDGNSRCAVWASRGECSKNPSYMLTSCCAGCASAFPCRDQNNHGSAWASSNQCNVNPAYMQTSCCGSCF